MGRAGSPWTDGAEYRAAPPCPVGRANPPDSGVASLAIVVRADLRTTATEQSMARLIHAPFRSVGEGVSHRTHVEEAGADLLEDERHTIVQAQRPAAPAPRPPPARARRRRPASGPTRLGRLISRRARWKGCPSPAAATAR